MKRRLLKLLLLIAAVLIPFYLSATITSITGVTMVPPAPLPGASVSISFTYTTDTDYDSPEAIIAISDTTAFRNAGTAGQWLMLSEASCSTPALPATAPAVAGCEIGTSIHPPGTFSVGPYNFTLPIDLASGVPYYIIVGAGTHWCQLNPTPGNIQATGASASFTLPLPPAAASITKTVEAINTAAGYRMMFTIFYNVVNTANFQIVDPIPAQLSFLKAFNSGAQSGSDVVWNFGTVTSRQTGSVSWMATVNAGVLDGTDIINTAGYSSTELGTVAGNSVTMTTGVNAGLSISNAAAPGVVNVGDNITYTLTYNNDGYTAEDYVPFDTAADITDWTQEVAGGSWWVSGGTLMGTSATGTWPKLIKNTPSLHDGIFISDMYIPASNAPQDAVMIFNFIDIGNMYHARFQADADQINFDRVVGTIWSTVATTPQTINNNTWYTTKVQVRGSNIKIKVWQRGTAEPGTWAINATDTSLTGPGRVGFQLNEGDDWFDNLKIYGPGPAMNTRIFDTVPACTTFAGCSDSCTQSGGMVIWDFPGRLDNALSKTVSFWVSADACAGGTNVTNTVCIDTDESTIPECSNEAYVSVNGVPMSPTITPTRTETPLPTMTYTPTYAPTLAFVKSVDINPALEGQTINYTINYSNTGLVAATNVIIQDQLNAYLTYVAGSEVPAANSAPAGGVPGGTIEWIIPSIAASGTGSVSFSAVVAASVPKGTIIQNQTSAVCQESAAAVLSNMHFLNLNIPDLKLTPVVNVPNPAVDTTEIIFNLTVMAEVTVKFYTVSGELVRIMEPAEVTARLQPLGSTIQPGNNRMLWDCKNGKNQPVASGIYFYRVEAKKGSETAFYMSKLAVLR